MNKFGILLHTRILENGWLTLLEQKESKYGIHNQSGSLKAVGKKVMRGGTVILNIGPFGNLTGSLLHG